MRFWKCSLAEANCFTVHSQNKLFVLCILNIYNFSSLYFQKTGRRGPISHRPYTFYNHFVFLSDLPDAFVQPPCNGHWPECA